MHEQRRAVALDALEQRPDAVEPAPAREGAGGDRDAGGARGEQPVDRVRPRPVERDRAPPPERRPERLHALVVRVEQRLGLAGRQGFDAQRARQRDQRAVEPVRLHEGRAALGVVVGGEDP